MRIFTNLALGLTLAASSVSAQTGFNQAPVPGPYMIINRQQPIRPAFTPQRFAMPMPYWMQNTRQPQQQPQVSTPAPAQARPAVGRANQQPVAPIAQNPNTQNNGNSPTPGFFPSYNSGPPQAMPRPQQPAVNYGAPTPTNNFAPMPWGQYGGQQGFMPMPAPWQNGQNGQNGWGNNWNNNGYGYRQGYAAPGRPRQ